MTNKPWLSSYPQGVPAEINLDEYRSVVDVFERSCEEYRDEEAFHCMGTSISYGELDRLSRNFAAALQDRGLRHGDRIAIMLPNLLQYPIALFGALRAGLTVVNTNPLYTARELKHQLIDSGARAMVVVDTVAYTLSEVRDEIPVEHIFVTGVGDLLDFPKSLIVNVMVRHIKKKVPPYHLPDAESFKSALDRGARLHFEPAAVTHDDLAFLQYTGGTTGVAKGAMLTHRNMVANMLQSRAWLKALESGGEVIITALPLYHIFALTANCLTFMSLGGRNILIPDPRNMEGFVKELARHRFTGITGVNTLFNGLLNTPGFSELDFSSVKLALAGGMALQRAVADRWKEVTGHTIVEAYGLTETSPAVCINPIDMEDFNGCIGLPIPSTDCSILNDAGEHLPQGESGELAVRGPQVMKGYWQRPEATAEVITPEGWLRTGDVAMMTPEGYFKIVDRKKDMILVSGFNVYPNEIEDVVALHPKVLEVAAIGVPDEKSGEAVKLCVVKKDPSLTDTELKDYCKENLTGYKRPKIIAFFDDLPKSNVGKILRKDLRQPAE